jgi:hypothetical protein
MPFQRLSKDEARREMADLVDGYRAQAADLEAPTSPYTETEARGQFIDRFLTILGWDVHNDNRLPQVEREVILERAGTDDASVIGRPDYRLRVRGRDRMPVEAKKPSVRLPATPAAARQARTYGWSLSLPAAVLINVAEMVIFDTTITPREDDGPDVAVIPGCRFTVEEYVPRFDELWERLSHEVVASERFYPVYSYQEPPRGSSPFDRTFLTEFRRWRYILATTIAAQNRTLQAPEVGRRTQRLLNALLFLRVCEDRNISQYEGLLRSAEAHQVLTAFRQADQVFNAGLFNVLDTTAVAPDILAAVIREMYWPRSKFAFGVLRPDILAALYEQYLAERVEVRSDRSVQLVPKPELTHAGGVVPTPGYIVEALLDEALGPLLPPTLDTSSDLTLLDPACGSGVFLVAALARLITSAETSGMSVGLAERARLVKEHLFGVDLDGEAVEVTKLSLLLAVLGGEIVDTQRSRKLLPDLDLNIQAGNSLVGLNFDAIVPIAASIPERRAAVAPVDLHALFSPVMTAGGFSAVVGNPPYIRIQTLAEYLPDQLTYFQDARSGLVSSQAYNFDTYLLFIERALTLLAPRGRLAFIVPNRFTNGLAGSHVRRVLGPRLERLVHFGEEQVFEHRTTYTALVVAAAKTSNPAQFELVRDLKAWRAGVRGNLAEVKRSLLTADPWPIASDEQAAVFETMQKSAIALLGDPDWVHAFVGVQTSADDIYFVTPDDTLSTPTLVHFTDAQGIQWDIERAILRPAVRDRRIEPYDRDPVPDAQAIFPYAVTDVPPGRTRRKARVFSPQEMATTYPKALAYLTAKKSLLVGGRNVSPDPGEAFWAYGRSQSLTHVDEPKLIVRVLSLTPRYGEDTQGLLVPGGGDGGPYYLLQPQDNCPYSVSVLLALLSHPAVDAFVASRGKAYRGSYVVHRKGFLVEVPVPGLNSATQRTIEAKVGEIQTTVVRLRTETDTAMRTTLGGRQIALRTQVDALITAAYGLTDADLTTVLG